jgi:beta-hydroxylase
VLRREWRVFRQEALALAEANRIRAAVFAMLPAGGKLNPHRDPFAGSLRYHLGLITPNDDRCEIIVDGIPYSWRDGEDVVFDETYLHHAANRTEQDRIILFCDVEGNWQLSATRRGVAE